MRTSAPLGEGPTTTGGGAKNHWGRGYQPMGEGPTTNAEGLTTNGRLTTNGGGANDQWGRGQQPMEEGPTFADVFYV